MTRRRWLVAAVLGALAAVGILILLSTQRGGPEARPIGERAGKPPLLLLTTLPIAFAEGFTLDGETSLVLAALQERYRVVPISVADRASLSRDGLLLMAQPQAQPAEALVELDRWVRDGGRVLLLADPALQWPSALALGDPARPPFAFADTGLLGHWGLRVEAPAELGPVAMNLDGAVLVTRSPGLLTATTADCTTSSGGLIAHCRIGRGRATVVADADFLAPSDPALAKSGAVALVRQLSGLER
ncbi:hypothetical protein H8M03_11000 [Sphingomonas sabuli]|uniref:ABC transporter n=1 Tax=Sphingomonas sabuli TaxID=2764186 RepID=A0A7G9L1M0_9SPHN|nr:hypothetical protein [Sphingomonas sabuli]QNM82519.1 hypothetical protein H8M03_11000 [Sphingomonas sabuli]